jgi:hypothetical protein
MENHQQEQHHNTKVGVSSTSTLGWKYSTRSWHLNNINTQDGNLQHEAEISTTSTRRLEIFTMNLASQQHQHEAVNL